MRIAVLFLAVLSSAASAQRQCKKGIPCGGTCISATKTCHVGTPTPRDTTEQAAIIRRLTGDTADRSTAVFGPFVGSVDGTVYYATSCTTAAKLTVDERVYFRDEQDAIAKGYHRSRAKNC